MTFEEYEKQAHVTADYPAETRREALNYLVAGITGEAGEIANKFKKVLRGDKDLQDMIPALREELGDVLWYASEMARHLDSSLAEIAAGNTLKLHTRKANGKIKGDGDGTREGGIV